MLPTTLLLVLALVQEPTVQIRPGTDVTHVEVTATPAGPLPAALPEGVLTREQGESWLRFCLVDPDSGREGPPILGTYRRKGGTLVFTPLFGLTYGQRYRAVLSEAGGKNVKADHVVPARAPTPPAVVEKIYPTTDVLPANHLKFYLYFSKPMRESKVVFDQIRMVDDKGKAVDEPWRRTELWSADCKRLTLWIHPGRIKRGVGPREDEGPVLEPDRRYRLVISKDMLDATGQPLGKDFEKAFRTTTDDRRRPLPEKWTVQAPRKGTTNPLSVEFGEPLDRPLLDRFLTVKDANGKPVAGRIEVGKEERSWLFHPERPWEARDYRLDVDGDLEDLAGNNPVRLFDVDLDEPAPSVPTLRLPFRPRS
jgi:hypothetical protein